MATIISTNYSSRGLVLDEIAELKRRCPLPTLMKHLGLGAHAVSSCRSPFRNDKKASWGIFQRDGKWFYKDLADAESGDEFDFLAQLLRLERDKNFALLVGLYRAIAETKPVVLDPILVAEERTSSPPDRTGFSACAEEQLEKLATLRGFSVRALQWATERGVLVYGTWNKQEVFGVTDQSGKVLEIRHLDGQPFPAAGSLAERKSHATKGSQKSWPVGILEAKEEPCIALVEGLPDFLAAHHLVWQEQTSGGHEFIQCAPVGMLAASVAIAEDALPQFAGKDVVIYPHADAAGLEAAARWQKQLQGVAREVAIFNMSLLHEETDKKVKDLNDFIRLKDDALLLHFPSLSAIMPSI